MKHFDNKALDIWRNYVLANYDKIDVLPGECRVNQKCHINSIHEGIRGKDEKLAVVIYFDEDGDPILHFANYHDGKFIDNTLGEYSQEFDYYFVRWIQKGQFNNQAIVIFREIRTFYERMVPAWYRWLLTVTI